MIDLQAFFRTLYMSCNVIRNITKTNKPLTAQYIFTYLLLTYLFTKIESGYPDPATGYRVPVPKPVAASNHYCPAAAAGGGCMHGI